jgi:hypothetical protein
VNPLPPVAGLLLFSGVALGQVDIVAPNSSFPPVNQLKISGNACGPAALLNAFGFGNKKWQEVGAAVPGKNDRSKLTYVIRGYGLKPSRHLERLRWTKSHGVNLLDLADMANEMRGSRWLPKIGSEVFVKERHELDSVLLRRIHSKLAYSLKKGLPPIISLQRLAEPSQNAASPLNWRIVHGHFIVLTALPSRLERSASSFSFQYVDPWGGQTHTGTIHVHPNRRYPGALAVIPNSEVGKHNLKRGERSVVTVSAALGDF